MAQAAGKRTPTQKRGLECPQCGCGHFRVLYTRRALGGRLLRRRECRHCRRRITTYEHSDAIGNARNALVSRADHDGIDTPEDCE